MFAPICQREACREWWQHLGWPLSDDPRDYLPFRGQRERMVAVMDRMEAAMDEAGRR